MNKSNDYVTPTEPPQLKTPPTSSSLPKSTIATNIHTHYHQLPPAAPPQGTHKESGFKPVKKMGGDIENLILKKIVVSSVNKRNHYFIK